MPAFNTNLTPEQRKENLAKAVAARHARAGLLDEMRSGKKSFHEGLDAAKADAVLARIRVYDLVRTQKGIGDRLGDRLMEEIGIAKNRRVGGLGSVQEEKLRAYFDAR